VKEAPVYFRKPGGKGKAFTRRRASWKGWEKKDFSIDPTSHRSRPPGKDRDEGDGKLGGGKGERSRGKKIYPKGWGGEKEIRR